METNWEKYIGIPYKHLGIDPKKGLDCLNLIKYIYKEELNIELPYTTRNFCDILDENWYSRTHERYFDDSKIFANGWEKTNTLEPFDAITMVMGTSSITNHCALYIGNNRIIHTIQNHKSHIAVYGSYYKQYTMGVYKWVGMKT
jgi:cell wall-associated NlpC family hydrolase